MLQGEVDEGVDGVKKPALPSDAEFEDIGDYEEGFLSEWWQEPRSKGDKGDEGNWQQNWRTDCSPSIAHSCLYLLHWVFITICCLISPACLSLVCLYWSVSVWPFGCGSSVQLFQLCTTTVCFSSCLLPLSLQCSVVWNWLLWMLRGSCRRQQWANGFFSPLIFLVVADIHKGSCRKAAITIMYFNLLCSQRDLIEQYDSHNICRWRGSIVVFLDLPK